MTTIMTRPVQEEAPRRARRDGRGIGVDASAKAHLAL